jgi:type I pantothenate kinase
MTEAPADGRADPQLLSVAVDLAARAAGSGHRPYVVGLVGSVSSGKTTTADALARLLDRVSWPGRVSPAARLCGTGASGGDGHDAGRMTGRVAVVSTDAFLLSNARIETLGGAMVKGYPQSYDWSALEQFLAGAAGGEPSLATPVYSHDVFDIVAGAEHRFDTPEVLIVEGLNLLQTPPTAPVDLSVHLDRSIYLHAPAAVLERWFVDRFLDTWRQAPPDSFYARFSGLDVAEVQSLAHWTWSEINAPNLRDHIEPTRARADVVVHLAADHSIERVQHRQPG